MKRATVKTKPSAPAYAAKGERILEFHHPKIACGGLISLLPTEDGMRVDVYRCDKGVFLARDETVRLLDPVYPAIRFIVVTYAAWSRGAGASRWARITSTITGRSLAVQHVGGANNIPSAVFKAIDPRRADFDTWSWINYQEIDVPGKQFSPPKDVVFEGNLTADMILQLEMPK